MKKGKEIRETINRYIELAGIAILKGDTGFDREKQILENTKKKEREKEKKHTYSTDQWRKRQRVIQLDRFPAKRKI